MTPRVKKICSQGHQYYKSSDCPTCPVCEKDKKPAEGFLSFLGSPARRALEREGIVTPERLAEHTEAQVLKLHGLGPASIPLLKKILSENGLTFKPN